MRDFGTSLVLIILFFMLGFLVEELTGESVEVFFWLFLAGLLFRWVGDKK